MESLDHQFPEGLILSTSRHETQSLNWVREYSKTIPDDLCIEIFSQVPATSIARFSCVSKYWASIFCRPDFTELFLTKSLTRPRLLFTFVTDGSLFFYTSPHPHNPDDNSSLVAIPYPTFLHHSTYICKQVCGLVLILGWGRKEAQVICNLAKGKVRALPKVPRYQIDTPRRIYLGYDPVGKQFKVLCMNMNMNFFTPITYWILTLESGKRLWKKLEPEFNFKEDGDVYGDICINGVLYFEGKLEGSFVIVCFDVRSEKFSFINKDQDMLPKPSAYYTGHSTLFTSG
ncbi:hypothetical protein Bca101_007433 [Brassica carinata]